jgi:hypothetical protein
MFRDTVVTSDGGSIHMTLLSLVVSKGLKLLALECSLLSFTHEQETSYSSYSLG